MGFLSRFKRKAAEATSPAGATATKRSSGGSSNSGSNAGAEAPADEVMRARVRARQRLIGAAVLVVIGIVGFPLVFETQPRPIPVDIPIEIPKKDGAPALAMPPARGPANTPREASAPLPSASVSVAPPANVALAPPGDVITESPADAGRPVTPTAPAAEAAKPAAKPAATKPAEHKPAEPKPADSKPAEAKVAAAVPAADSARAKALLEGKDASAARPESGRFVVQVGAFADVAAAREMRQKVEKLGLKTYTQVASTASGNRIRVRVGPFASRDEADKALAKAKGAGLNAVVLTL